MSDRTFPLGGIDGVFDHVGVVVPSISAMDASLVVIEDEHQRVGVAFADWGGLRVELIEPRGEASPVAGSLRKGQRLVHLCFRVRDIDAAIARARSNGLHCIARPRPARAFDNRRIAWLFGLAHGLIELLEEPPADGRPDAPL